MPNRQNKKGRSASGPPFVQLFNYLLDSPAWLSLTPQERSVYLVLARRYNGANNGLIGLSVRDAAAHAKVSKDTASRALQALVGRGFIDCVTQGGFSLKTRHAAEWRLNCYRCNKTLELPSKAFMRWQPDLEVGPNPDRDGPLLGCFLSR